MSTRIYNGYVLPSMTLNQLSEFNKDLTRQVRSKVDELVAIAAGDLIASYIDDWTMRFHFKKVTEDELPSTRSVLSEAYDFLRKRHREIMLEDANDPRYDFGFSVVYLPMKKKILAMLFTSQDELKDIWLKMKGVSEYAYYNNSDQPDGITDKQWEKRGKDWDSVLEEFNYVPSAAGFITEPIDKNYILGPLDMNSVIAKIPLINRRLSDSTDIVCFDRWYESIGSKEYPEVTPSDIYELNTTFLNYMKTPEGLKLYTSSMNELQKVLIHIIRRTHITKNIKEILTPDLDT